MNTSTEMVNALFENTGTLFTDMLPFFYILFGLLMFLFCFKLFGGSLRQALRQITK